MRYEISYNHNSITLKSNLSGEQVSLSLDEDTLFFGNLTLFHTRNIIQTLTNSIASQDIKLVKFKNFKHERKKLKWYKFKTYRYLCKAIAKKLNEFRNTLNPDLVAIHKRIFNIIGPKRSIFNLNLIKYLLKNRYQYSDFMKYKCCAYVYCNYSPLEQQGKDWKDYYVSNKVCMQYQGKINMYVFNTLKRMTFVPKNYFQVVASSNNREVFGNKSILLKASNYEIQKTQRYLRENTGTRYDFRKSSDIFNFCTYLLDYPEAYNGSLLGLARRSVEWHRRYHRGTGHSSSYTPETSLSVFPFQIHHPSVKQLVTVLDLNKESSVMQHCVASYAKYCIDGESFIFHVEHLNDKATIEVRKSGNSYYVSQSQGPQNKKNKASEWATKFFNKFIKKEIKDDNKQLVTADRCAF